MNAQQTVLFDLPGPKARLRYRLFGVVAVIVLVAILLWILRGLHRNGQLAPELWLPFLDPTTWTQDLLPGLAKTLGAAGLAIVISVVFGTLLGLGRLSHLAPVRLLCGIFVEFFRSVPVLVMMLFAYFFASFVLELDQGQPFFGVVVGLVLYNSSVIAELIRSGVHSLPGGQREAGLAIGMTQGQTLWSVLLPQAITAMLPSLVSQLVVILKDTALGALFGYSDLLLFGQTWSNNFGNLIPVMIVMAAMFIVINYSLTTFAGWLERKLGRRVARDEGRAAQDEPAEVKVGG